MSLTNSADNPSETPLSTFGRQNYSYKDRCGSGSRVRIRVIKGFFFPFFCFLNSFRVSNMDGEDTVCLVVLEKKGLHQSAGILESYGIDSETDVSLFDRDDFSKLSSNGLKPMEGKKLERWSNDVRARAENMLTHGMCVRQRQ